MPSESHHSGPDPLVKSGGRQCVNEPERGVNRSPPGIFKHPQWDPTLKPEMPKAPPSNPIPPHDRVPTNRPPPSTKTVALNPAKNSKLRNLLPIRNNFLRRIPRVKDPRPDRHDSLIINVRMIRQDDDQI